MNQPKTHPDGFASVAPQPHRSTLLVGSLSFADETECTTRALETLGPSLFYLPDGEVGEKALNQRAIDRMQIVEKETETLCPANRAHWRAWLQEHHADKQSIWLIYHKKKSTTPSLTWSEAVDEALCFGWIDSRAKPVDDHTYKQFFSRRKPKSVWSKINKEKVKRLIDEGLMTPSGLNAIDIAKQNGSWTILDEVDALIIPPDLEETFLAKPVARGYFLSLSRSDKRAILQWLLMAKRPQTRQNRITELVDLADQGLKPKMLR